MLLFLATRSATLFSAAFLLVLTVNTAFADAPILNANDAAVLVAEEKIVVLDIRTPQEWQETGIAKGAWPVSMHTPEFPQQLAAILDRYAPNEIALICATGGRTAYVADILEKNGIQGVLDVSEGMLGNGASAGWIAKGLPIVTVQEAQAQYDEVKETWD